jgi:hypothetical protein
MLRSKCAGAGLRVRSKSERRTRTYLAFGMIHRRRSIGSTSSFPTHDAWLIISTPHGWQIIYLYRFHFFFIYLSRRKMWTSCRRICFNFTGTFRDTWPRATPCALRCAKTCNKHVQGRTSSGCVSSTEYFRMSRRFQFYRLFSSYRLWRMFSVAYAYKYFYEKYNNILIISNGSTRKPKNNTNH